MRSHFSIATLRLTLVAVCVTCTSLRADDWSRFRGPNGSGVADGRNIPAEFGPAQNVIWKASVPAGNSSPVLTADRVFLTAHTDQSLFVICLDKQTGKTLWQKSVVKQRTEKRSARNDAATPTPVTDGKNVYAFFSDFGLISYDSQGAERWRVLLGPFKVPHGMATSPILAGDRVILVADQTEGSFIAAFDKNTGRQAWKVERLNIAGGYSTPIVYQSESGGTQVIVFGPLELASYSIETGKKVWAYVGLGLKPVSVPALNRDTVYINTETAPTFRMLVNDMKADRNQDGLISADEFPTHAFRKTVLEIDREYGNRDGMIDAVEWDKALGITQSADNAFLAVTVGKGTDHQNQSVPVKIKWRVSKLLLEVSSVLLYRDIIYLVKNGGIVTTLNPETGEILKQERLKGAIDSYFASPVAADGKIFFVGETGKVAVVKAGGNDWDVLAVNNLEEECYATPAITDNRIYIRTRTSLYAFGHASKGNLPINPVNVK